MCHLKDKYMLLLYTYGKIDHSPDQNNNQEM